MRFCKQIKTYIAMTIAYLSVSDKTGFLFFLMTSAADQF